MLQILFFLLVALIHGRSLNQFHRKCGSRDYIPEIDASLEATVAQAIADGTAEDNFQWPITVNVNFHVIMGGNTTDQGNVPDSWITNQIELLNKDYSNTFVNFNLNTITRTLNETWFDEIDYDNEIETAMKQELRQGDSLTLNIYTAKLSGGLLGWATFPTDLADRPWRDGVVVHFNTLPGGKLAPFNLGRTLTHEAGHWFGLWHTFQDSCSCTFH